MGDGEEVHVLEERDFDVWEPRPDAANGVSTRTISALGLLRSTVYGFLLTMPSMIRADLRRIRAS